MRGYDEKEEYDNDVIQGWIKHMMTDRIQNFVENTGKWRKGIKERIHDAILTLRFLESK